MLRRITYVASMMMVILSSSGLSSPSALAATPLITGIAVVSEAQSLDINIRSQPIVIEFRNAGGEPEAIGLTSAQLQVNTSSSTGKVYASASATDPHAGAIEIEEGSSSVAVFYQDEAPGDVELTFTFTTDGLSPQMHKATHRVTIVPPPVVEPPVVPESVVQLEGYSQKHTSNADPVKVRGTLEYIPETASVWAYLKNPNNIEVSKSLVMSRGVGIGLADLSLAQPAVNGMYVVELLLTKEDGTIVMQSVPLEVAIAPSAPVTPPSVGPGVPTLVPPKAVPLELLEPVELTLSTQFSTPRTLASARSQTFVAAASQKATTNAALADGEEQQALERSMETESAISLTSGEQESVVEATKEGWKVFGAPWYLWGAGGTAVYGAWFGLRRLIHSGE